MAEEKQDSFLFSPLLYFQDKWVLDHDDIILGHLIGQVGSQDVSFLVPLAQNVVLPVSVFRFSSEAALRLKQCETPSDVSIGTKLESSFSSS